MSVFCMSDIHGHFDEFQEMLDKIAFSSSDELYVLGDIIDKGPGSAAMLKWAIDEAGDNVHFMLGNHEDIMAGCIERDPEQLTWVTGTWARNGGMDTAVQLLSDTSAEWRRERLMPWLDSLSPVIVGVEAGGRRFALVHAGFNPARFESHPEGWEHVPEWIDYNPDVGALNDRFQLPNGLGIQTAQDMLWVRSSWLLDPEPAPMETVFGHTRCSSEIRDLIVARDVDAEARGGGGRILHALNRHGIDCGCAYAQFEPEGNHNLACLRLDDFEEFYIPVKGRD